MFFRDYSSEDLTWSAATIASEVVQYGTSTGWCGSVEDRESIASHLRPHGIVYVDDMRGEWAARGSR